MTAEIHQLLSEEPEELPLAPSGSVYLDAYLGAFRQWLDRDTVTEIIVNRPGEVWIEDSASEGMQLIEAPEIDDKLVQRLAEQVARVSHQGINREHPLLGATLPDGARVQFCGPPATRKHWAMAIRRHRRLDLPLDAYDAGPLRVAQEAYMPDPAAQPIAFLRAAIAARKTILISGGTSTGKTTFLNTLLREIPEDERLILIEDTPELDMTHANSIGLIAPRSALGEAEVRAEDLLMAALRMRPDRIILGELRGPEAFTFLRAVNSGHPGSMTTIHADSSARAIEQLVLLVLQAGSRLAREDVRHYVRASIDVFVQLERIGGRRKVTQVLVRD